MGTDAAGTLAVANGGAGVSIGSSGNTIGGTTPFAGNLLSGNKFGVYIADAANLVEGNQIGTDVSGTSALADTDDGIIITSAASDNTIGGMVSGAGNLISGNSGDGIYIGGSDNLVAGNQIGTAASGTKALPNAVGVSIHSKGNTIGGTTPGAGNLISGNQGDGVRVTGATAAGNLVQGNVIGTDTTGEAGLGNTGTGVDLINAPDNTIGGPVGGARNLISGNAEGILITGSATTGSVIAGNLIGTDVSGAAAVGNIAAGVVLAGGSGTSIGGTTALARNVISGNAGDGVDVQSGATNTLVQGNFIGVDQTGTRRLGNAGAGVSDSGAAGATVGGTAVGAGNVISANLQSGLSIQGPNVTAVLIVGNLIGTDTSGLIGLGNGLFGVLVSDASGAVIGGPLAGERNVISGNIEAGVGLFAGTTGAAVEGNLIGTDVLGSSPLGNGIGVQISGGSSNNTIGGASGAGNSIAFSAGIGVDVDPTAGAGNLVRLNSIFSSGGLGIDLGGDGVTLNDSVPHNGPNDRQNFPVITGVSSAGGTTTVTGTLASLPIEDFTLDFYTVSEKNASGHGEGRYLLGSKSVSTDNSGAVGFSFSFPTPATGAQIVTATATDAAGSTSEFSGEFGGNQPPSASIGFATLTVDLGVAVKFDGLGSTDPDDDPLQYSWSFGDGDTATGATPSHIFKTVGTSIVTLTVSDGFGGTSQATASVTVKDVAPAFAPRSLEPPATFAAPMAGDGFGGAVAAVDGNVAIAAKFDSGGVGFDAGTVYLYDGVPTDDGISSTSTYGTLLHVFGDPNPAPGDEFGASIAAVGNDLLVGAPGSSITGPGDGAAYLYDANPDSETFGKLLATFTIANPDAAHHAEFGESVGSADTNLLIGAPGKDGGTGEVDVFQGDPTAPLFGSLILAVPNPDAQAARGSAPRSLGWDST